MSRVRFGFYPSEPPRVTQLSGLVACSARAIRLWIGEGHGADRRANYLIENSSAGVTPVPMDRRELNRPVTIGGQCAILST